jgi:hypothetical protein
MYRFTLGEPDTIRVRVIAEFPVAFGIDRIDTCDYAPPLAYFTQHEYCAEFTHGTDGAMAAGDYMFWITPMNYTGFPFADSLHYRATLLATTVDAPAVSSVVTDYALHQNYPNPFNPATTLSFDLAMDGFVSLKIYNLLGQLCATPVEKVMTRGSYTLSYDASHLPSGIYIYRMDSGGFTAQRKMLLIK